MKITANNPFYTGRGTAASLGMTSRNNQQPIQQFVQVTPPAGSEAASSMLARANNSPGGALALLSDRGNLQYVQYGSDEYNAMFANMSGIGRTIDHSA